MEHADVCTAKSCHAKYRKESDLHKIPLTLKLWCEASRFSRSVAELYKPWKNVCSCQHPHPVWGSYRSAWPVEMNFILLPTQLFSDTWLSSGVEWSFTCQGHRRAPVLKYKRTGQDSGEPYKRGEESSSKDMDWLQGDSFSNSSASFCQGTSCWLL